MIINYIYMSTEQEAEEHSKIPGNWLVANIEQFIGWPTKKQIIIFRGVKLLVLPELPDTYPGLALRKSETSEDPVRLINDFLSSLVWKEHRPISVKYWSGGGLPYVMGKDRLASFISPKFRIEYLQDPSDKKTRLALAFYREALTLNHKAYSFLSYYKIINLRFPESSKQMEWVNSEILKLADPELQKILSQIPQKDKGNYLYVSCRCAIAHAGIDPVVDPDNQDDIKRLSNELPLIKYLSEQIIENEYGVKSSRTIYTEHKYETFGIREIIGEDNIKKLINNDPALSSIQTPERISIRLWGRSHIDCYEKMKIVRISNNAGIIAFDCSTEDELLVVRICFDLNIDKILFDIENGIFIGNDGSAISAKYVAEYFVFKKEYYLNGILEVWDEVENKCLAWADSFIPTNIDVAGTIKNFDHLIEEYNLLYRKRTEEAAT